MAYILKVCGKAIISGICRAKQNARSCPTAGRSLCSIDWKSGFMRGGNLKPCSLKNAIEFNGTGGEFKRREREGFFSIGSENVFRWIF